MFFSSLKYKTFMRYITVWFVQSMIVSIEGIKLRCSGDACISPLPLMSSSYNPGTLETGTSPDGLLTVRAVAGDSPLHVPPSPGDADADYAIRFTIQSPSIIQPDPGPPLIVCRVGSCTTTTTPLPDA